MQAKANLADTQAEPAPDTSTAASSEAEAEFFEADRRVAEEMAETLTPAAAAEGSEDAEQPEVSFSVHVPANPKHFESGLAILACQVGCS